MLTPLQTRALSWSQYVTDYIWRYRPPIYWDRETKTLRKESNCRHVLPWLVINYVIVGATQSFGSVIFFFKVLKVPKYASSLQILVTIGIAGLSIAAFVTGVSFRKWAFEFVEFINKILAFEDSLSLRYSSGLAKISTVTPSRKMQISNQMNGSIRPPSGRVDVIGTFSMFLVVVFSIIPPFLPWMGIWLELDMPFIMKQQLLGKYCKMKTLGIVIRVTCCLLTAVEVCNCFRLLSLLAIPEFRSLHSCHMLLHLQPICEYVLRELMQLKILFGLIWEWTAFLLCTYLATVYVVLLASATGLVAMVNEIPWYLYSFAVLIAFVNLSLITVLLFLVVSIDQISSELHQVWMRSLSQHHSHFKRRLLRKILESIRPIRIPYGTVGAFKQATRTDFFSSLTENSLNCILAFTK